MFYNCNYLKLNIFITSYHIHNYWDGGCRIWKNWGKTGRNWGITGWKWGLGYWWKGKGGRGNWWNIGALGKRESGTGFGLNTGFWTKEGLTVGTGLTFCCWSRILRLIFNLSSKFFVILLTSTTTYFIYKTYKHIWKNWNISLLAELKQQQIKNLISIDQEIQNMSFIMQPKLCAHTAAVYHYKHNQNAQTSQTPMH